MCVWEIRRFSCKYGVVGIFYRVSINVFGVVFAYWYLIAMWLQVLLMLTKTITVIKKLII